MKILALIFAGASLTQGVILAFLDSWLFFVAVPIWGVTGWYLYEVNDALESKNGGANDKSQ